MSEGLQSGCTAMYHMLHRARGGSTSPGVTSQRDTRAKVLIVLVQRQEAAVHQLSPVHLNALCTWPLPLPLSGGPQGRL